MRPARTIGVRCNQQASRWAIWMLALVAVAGLQAPFAVAQDAAHDDQGGNPNVQVLTRGPVHEAFALPVVFDPKPGLVVPKPPPQPVEEMPPDQKPAGPNVLWITGYWSWDEPRNDFIWVSGIWREPPPGRQWVPGYWNQVANGYQWVPGAWVPVDSPQIQGTGQEQPGAQPTYLPAPPASLEAGPNSPSPGSQVFWTPGSWFWQGNRYVWRPGFWAALQQSWIWIPAHYAWSPGGYLFIEGYWDLPLDSRGMLFAPVYYAQPVYLQPRYVFTPAITIATPALVGNLFVQPGYSHYCFGDYYDQTFLSVGIFPWFQFTYASGPARPVFYDPIFSFYAALNVRQNAGWVTRVREDYIYRRDHVAMRPPRTYIEQTRIVQRNINIQKNVNITNNVTINHNGRNPEMTRQVVMARPLNQVDKGPGPGLAGESGPRLERLNQERRREMQVRGGELRQFREQRLAQESGTAGRAPGRAAAGSPEQTRPRPNALPRSPIASPPIRIAEAHDGAQTQALSRHKDSQPAQARRESPRHERSESPAANRGGHVVPPAVPPADRRGTANGVQLPSNPSNPSRAQSPIQHDRAIPARIPDHLSRLDLPKARAGGHTPGTPVPPQGSLIEGNGRQAQEQISSQQQPMRRQPPPPPRPFQKAQDRQGPNQKRDGRPARGAA